MSIPWPHWHCRFEKWEQGFPVTFTHAWRDMPDKTFVSIEMRQRRVCLVCGRIQLREVSA